METGRGGASGRPSRPLRNILLMFLIMGVSSPKVDQPLSTKHGTFAGIGVARPEVYFRSLTMVEYFPDPIIKPARRHKTSTMVGSRTVTGCIP